MCSCIALVGYDCFNKSLDDTINEPSIRFWLFPTALENLLSLPKWKEITPQVCKKRIHFLKKCFLKSIRSEKLLKINYLIKNFSRFWNGFTNYQDGKICLCPTKKY